MTAVRRPNHTGIIDFDQNTFSTSAEMLTVRREELLRTVIYGIGLQYRLVSGQHASSTRLWSRFLQYWTMMLFLS